MPSLGVPTCLQDLLQIAAASQLPEDILLYPIGNTSAPTSVSYRSLYHQALKASWIVSSLPGFEIGAPIILHLDDHWDAIYWFWAVLLADGLPVLSSPFSNIAEHRHKHINNLSSLLQSPVCITRSKFLGAFDCHHGIKIHTIESLRTASESPGEIAIQNTGHEAVKTKRHSRSNNPAILMLTSGSTGNAKAVQLDHTQILAAVRGKASVRALPKGKPFLNWIGLDHVASLVEIHLQAMYLGVRQIHVQAADVISSPQTFLDLLSRHEVARSFAPNFFLAKLVSTVQKKGKHERCWSLRHLTVLASGGEANDVRTCVAASAMLSELGAPRNVITTGFGMTETCAGSIFNLNCPDYDVKEQREFASLGKCMKGIEMRVTLTGEDGDINSVAPGECGELEVRGEVVFQGYYRNEQATTQAFHPGGWFRTGDQASIDAAGNLNLIGRMNDTVNINGVKINPADLQASLEQALLADVSCIVVFATRALASSTEQMTVAYIPKLWPPTPDHTVCLRDVIMREVISSTGAHPIIFALDDESCLPKSTLGKISKAKMRSLFENGHFSTYIDLYQSFVRRDSAMSSPLPSESKSEVSLIQDFKGAFDISAGVIGVDTSIFELGIDSMALISLKRRMETRLGFEVPIITIMSHPTARELSQAIEELESARKNEVQSTESLKIAEKAYNPVVTLRHGGNKAPLWLVHPGVGEVLVFLGLSNLITDRPVHALRARGFDGEPHFSDLTDVVDTYLSAIKKTQPSGPYALAGYSYGSMIAFELAKRLESEGEEIKFLGSFNLPPHIKNRMRQLNWNMCLLHLAYFLGLTTEQFADNISDNYKDLPRDDAMAIVLTVADTARMTELGLDERGLVNWAQLAFGLQSLAVDFEPSGSVAHIDVFHAVPLKVAAQSRADWLENHLSKWVDFSRSEPRYHEVGGAHYTMINPEHVVGFAKTLNQVLEERGV